MQDYLLPRGRRTLAVASGVLALAVTGLGSQAGAASHGTPTLSLSAAYLSGAVGASGDPVVKVTVAQSGADAGALTVTVTKSSKTSVATTADVTVTGTGATRQVAIAARGRGYTDLTVKVTGVDGDTATKTLHYAASAAVQQAADSRYFTGSSYASAAVDVGGGYAVVADDESNTLRLYDRSASGAPMKTWDFSSNIGVSKEIDIEGATRVGDTIYWTGSLGNNKDGEYKSARNTVFTTKVSGSARRPCCRTAARNGSSATTSSPGTWPTATVTASRRAPPTARSPSRSTGSTWRGWSSRPGRRRPRTSASARRSPRRSPAARRSSCPSRTWTRWSAAAPRPSSGRRSSWTSAASPCATCARTPRTST